MNYGNTGHRDYKMAKVLSITPQEDNMIAIALSCGHTQYWDPYPGTSAQEWAAHIQQGYRPIEIGKTRLRCGEKHEVAG